MKKNIYSNLYCLLGRRFVNFVPENPTQDNPESAGKPSEFGKDSIETPEGRKKLLFAAADKYRELSSGEPDPKSMDVLVSAISGSLNYRNPEEIKKILDEYSDEDPAVAVQGKIKLASLSAQWLETNGEYVEGEKESGKTLLRGLRRIRAARPNTAVAAKKEEVPQQSKQPDHPVAAAIVGEVEVIEGEKPKSKSTVSEDYNLTESDKRALREAIDSVDIRRPEHGMLRGNIRARATLPNGAEYNVFKSGGKNPSYKFERIS